MCPTCPNKECSKQTHIVSRRHKDSTAELNTLVSTVDNVPLVEIIPRTGRGKATMPGPDQYVGMKADNPKDALYSQETPVEALKSLLDLNSSIPKGGFIGGGYSTKKLLKSVLKEGIDKMINLICANETSKALTKEILFELYVPTCIINVAKKFEDAAIGLLLKSPIARKPYYLALISKVMSRTELNEILNENYEGAIQVGRKLWRNSIKNHALLLQGEDIVPVQQFTRVNSTALLSSFDFITTTCQVIPGQLRSAVLWGQLFKSIPIFVTPESNSATFLKKYQTHCKESNLDMLGEKAFRSVLKLLTRPSKQQTCLSSFYVEFSNLDTQFTKVLDDLNTYGFTNCKKWRKDWIECVQFAKYEYSRHLYKNDQAYHSTCFGLTSEAVTIGLWDSLEVCRSCHQCFNFFKGFKIALDTFYLSSDTWPASVSNRKQDVVDILDTIDLYEEHLHRYLAHKCRERKQRTEFLKIKKELQDDECIVILDHKMKVLPMKFQEGQSDFFGKAGMSYLGNMVLYREQSGIEPKQLKYEFVDVVFNNCAEQNANQVKYCLIRL